MVIFLIQWLRSGGAEKQVLIIATGLAKAGVPCRVMTLAQCQPQQRIESLVAQAEAAGVIMDRPTLFAYRSNWRLVQLFFFLLRSPRATVWTWGRRADFVGKLAAKLNRRLRLVCALVSAHKERMIREGRSLRFFNRRVDLFVSNSFYNCELLELVAPGSLPRCRVVHNPLSITELAEKPVELPASVDCLRVVMLGNLRVQIKGYDTVLRVAARLREVRVPVEFHIAGRADEAAVFLSERARLGLDQMVHYHGETSRPAEFLRSGHVFLLASRVEGMPNALIEAMNLGLPCIATRVGDVGRFAQDRIHLRVVEIDDAEGIADTIEELRRDWPQTLRLGAAARDLCQRDFTPERITQQTLEVLREVGEQRN